MKIISVKKSDELWKEDKYDVVIVNTYFELSEIKTPYKEDGTFYYIQDIVLNIEKHINKNGLIYIYGITQELIYFALELNKRFIFKYWNVIDIVRDNQDEDLPNNHVGLLVYSVSKNLSLFTPNKIRIPYKACTICGKNVKDWGGKKHLMNKNGTALSDVWTDFNVVKEVIKDPDVENIELLKIDIDKLELNLQDCKIPKKVLNRILNMSNTENVLQVNLYNSIRNIIKAPEVQTLKSIKVSDTDINDEYSNKIFLRDSIDLLKEIIDKYPNGYFDLIFADPPYNLVKKYKDHNDGMEEIEYIKWCNEWLSLCSKALKPNGSLYVLNIPKWSIYHAEELNKHMYLKNWIVWDALSVPMGKVMPAHYTLLYYVKNPNDYTFNLQFSTERKDLCLRNKCIKIRINKDLHFDKVNNIWSDIHRIKHKKDRDEHPCQLPLKLMNRIIKMSTNKNDIVYDPFCGAGTTAIAAKGLGRKYCSSDISDMYVQITEKNLQNIDDQGSLNRKSVKKLRTNVYTKKEIELRVQELAKKYNRKITINELLRESPFEESDLISLYKNLSIPLKACSKVIDIN
ncbi:DNA adenine methylase [Sulfurimonas sp. NW15]|uniref:DNA-methyltransferase n=1 Tax=Sulfurimonas sp. NW15 TaxID=2922729 RepID=UPI003DAA000F